MGLYTRTRLLVKSLSWRILSTTVSFLLIYYVTGSVLVAANVAVINFFLKYFLFYVHERIWEKYVKWGLNPNLRIKKKKKKKKKLKQDSSSEESESNDKD